MNSNLNIKQMKKVLIKLNQISKNERIYKPEILESFLNKEYFGEINHPDNSVVNVKKISHKINNLEIKDNELLGEVEILNTPEGNKLKEIGIENVVFRPRGFGNINENKEVENYELIAFDAILKYSDPF